MTPLANHISVFLRQRLPIERRASELTSETYALALRLFVEFAAERLKVRPSALQLEQLDAPLVLEFLTHLETQRHNSPATRNVRLAAIRTFMRFPRACPTSVAGERYCAPRLAIRPAQRPCTGSLSQCTWRSDDSFRIRVCLRQACADSGSALPLARG
jgi:hypothetical protein